MTRGLASLVVFAAHGTAAQTYCFDQACGTALLNEGWTLVAEVRDCATRYSADAGHWLIDRLCVRSTLACLGSLATARADSEDP